MFKPQDNDDRSASNARHAAEALFTPKQQRDKPHPGPEDVTERKPRILAALPPARPATTNVAESSTVEKRRPIPKSKIDSIRTWLRFGMTVDQVADVCEVPVAEIKRALQAAAVPASGDR